MDSQPQENRPHNEASASLSVAPRSAIFLPLKREFFEAFERGEKTHEYREHGPRWNERTCTIGRPVVLSLGYGKARRLRGVVSSFDICATPQLLPGWRECYGSDTHRSAAVIGITILPNDGDQPRAGSAATPKKPNSK